MPLNNKQTKLSLSFLSLCVYEKKKNGIAKTRRPHEAIQISKSCALTIDFSILSFSVRGFWKHSAFFIFSELINFLPDESVKKIAESLLWHSLVPLYEILYRCKSRLFNSNRIFCSPANKGSVIVNAS